MTITLNIILDALCDYNIEHFLLDANRRFKQVDVLPQYSDALYADRLYICGLSEALKLTREHADVSFLSLRDRFNSIDETPELMKNIVVVNENISVTTLFSNVLDIFIKIINWQWDMQNAFIKNKPMQELLILSQPVIGNFISISDSSLTLLTYTPDISTDDPVSNALIDYGYHTEDALRRFKGHNRFELWENTEGFLFDDDRITSPYPVVSRVFKYGGTYFTHVVMVCNNRPITPGLLDLFSILIESLTMYIDKDWQQKQEFSRVYDPLITNILDNPELPTDVFNDRIEQVGIPLEADYYLLKLLPMKNPGQPAGIIAQSVQQLLPEAKIIIYHHSLLILIHEDGKDCIAKLIACQEKLQSIVEQNGLCCGISPRFLNLKHIRQAFSHATLALNYGRSLSGFQPGSVYKGPFFKYEDYYLYMLLAEQDNLGILTSAAPYRWLTGLHQYDREHNTNNFDLLYLYLTNERHAGNTAKMAFMSRNNLVYRIGRIREIINIDLDDYFVRMQILATYEMLKLHPELLTACEPERI